MSLSRFFPHGFLSSVTNSGSADLDFIQGDLKEKVLRAHTDLTRSALCALKKSRRR